MWTFLPILKSTIWGGNRISQFKGIATSQPNIGESWELSGVEGDESVVANGPDKGMTLPELIDKYGAQLLGKRNYVKYGNRFPLLIKFIDAQADLSVQVHPTDELAHLRGKPSGKTEMWYVISADRGARLANGFTMPVDPEQYDSLVESGEIEKHLNFEHIKAGDVFYIPAGRVHAIGKGAFVAEIQETSDITYRIYDYHRKDKEGHERELHTKLAFDAINFNDTDGAPVKYVARKDIPVNVVTSPFFTTNILDIDEELIRDYSEWDTFVVLIATKGSAEIRCAASRKEGESLCNGETIELKAGHSILIPATARGITIEPHGDFTALETYLK